MLQPSQWSPSLLKDKINMTTKLANHSEEEKGKKKKRKKREVQGVQRTEQATAVLTGTVPHISLYLHIIMHKHIHTHAHTCTNTHTY